MRQVVIGAALGLALLLPGCKLPWVRPEPAVQGLNVGSAAPSKEQLLAALNRNAALVRSLECRNVELDCAAGRDKASLAALMVGEKPRSFRLRGKVMAMDEVDIGSNDREFWYWIKRAPQPYLFHCSHQDFATGNVPLPFPFQPDWIIEALGIAEFGAADSYEVVVGRERIDLMQQAQAPDGRPVRKVTVLSRANNQLHVAAHLLQTADGRELICAAYVTALQQDSVTKAVLPRQLQLVWPAQQLKMKMTLPDVIVNGQLDQRRAALFSRPEMNGVQPYDLARGPDAPAGPVRRARGLFRGSPYPPR